MSPPVRLCAALTAAALVALSAAPAGAFEIDKKATFLAVDVHEGKGIHEAITREALQAGRLPDGTVASAVLIENVQRGVENTDIMHQFDSESHFDNASMSADGGRGFTEAFDRVEERIQAAADLAAGNPQALHPTFTNAQQIAADVEAAVWSLLTNGDCVLDWDCPTSDLAYLWGTAWLTKVELTVSPSPDPHDGTDANNPFSSFNPNRYRRSTVRALVAAAQTLAETSRELPETTRSLAQALQFYAEDPEIVDAVGANVAAALSARMTRDIQAVDAYLAFNEIGHALHSTEDFFAHSNYVELMTGTPVGQPITGVDPSRVRVPAYARFNLAGLRSFMNDRRHPRRFSQLQTGAVRTIWLDEGDYCLGDAGVLSIFNPHVLSGDVTLGGWRFGPWRLTWPAPLDALDLPTLEIPAVQAPGLRLTNMGHNPNPPRGFRYCHYPTSTTIGLNKDSDLPEGGARGSHVNYRWARAAAVTEATNVWSEFLSRL